jgi:hypothetical protein
VFVEGDITGGAPVRERLGVLRRYWLELDELLSGSDEAAAWLSILAGPGPKGPPVYVGSDSEDALHDDNGGLALRPAAHLFSAGLAADIERLWGTKVLPRWPDRLVTQPAPHARAAAAFGAVAPNALLNAVGVWTAHERPEYGPTPTTTLREDREALTHERRTWARERLDGYLQSRWDRVLDQVTAEYQQQMESRSRPLTAKQFAGLGAYVANQWFAGDLTGVYWTLGLDPPTPPTVAVRLVPHDPEAFARALHDRLEREYGARAIGYRDRYWQRPLPGLAGLSIRYLQLQEALGQPPRMGELGKDTFLFFAPILDDEPVQAWRRYRELISDVLREFERDR